MCGARTPAARPSRGPGCRVVDWPTALFAIDEHVEVEATWHLPADDRRLPAPRPSRGPRADGQADRVDAQTQPEALGSVNGVPDSAGEAPGCPESPRQDPPTGAARGPTRSSACRTRTRRVRRPCAP